jgi:hypothetical protein
MTSLPTLCWLRQWLLATRALMLMICSGQTAAIDARMPSSTTIGSSSTKITHGVLAGASIQK